MPPLLCVPIVRTRQLSEFHSTVWQHTAHTASGTIDYYRLEAWLPHITLAFGDIHRDNLPGVTRLLSERPLHWRIAINNLSFIEDTGQSQKEGFRFDFGRRFGFVVERAVLAESPRPSKKDAPLSRTVVEEQPETTDAPYALLMSTSGTVKASE